MCPIGIEYLTSRLHAVFLYGTILHQNYGEKKRRMAKKVGPVGIEPAACDLADNGFIPARLHINCFLLYATVNGESSS